MRTKLLFLLLALAALEPACSRGAPDLELERREMDLGPMPNGEVREFEVRLRNLGSAPLIIEAVTTSCGCTTARVEPTEIAPGDTAVLEMTFDSGAHGPELVGALTRHVFIASNDPDEPEVTFVFSAEVTAP